MKKLLVAMLVAGLAGCATMQPPGPIATQPRLIRYNRWAALQQSAGDAAVAAAAAGEDPTATYFNLMSLAAKSVLQDADPRDWAWEGKGPRPSAEVFQQDRYRSFQGAKDMIAGTGANNPIINLGSAFVGGMDGLGWQWQ